MSETERLHRAVQIAITAGYQLNKEAFEFLSMVCSSEDPTEIISKAVQEMDSLQEKPPFIEKRFLERLLDRDELSIKEPAQPEGWLHLPVSESEPQEVPATTEGKTSYHPFAKDIEPSIRIIEDPTSEIGSEGTFEDYLEYFRDRFKRTEKLLRQRIDVKAATSITEALKAAPNTRLKIIGMVTEKRESKQRTILTVEDMEAQVAVLVPSNAEEHVRSRARLLVLDQIICLSVTKTRSNLLIAEDLILPDVPQKPQHKASLPVYAVLTSDMHVGSTKFQREAFDRFVLWLNGKYGDANMRRMASHVKYVVVAGDIVDGVGIYPNQIRELAVKDVNKQYKLASSYIEQIPEYVEVIICPGNHDALRKALPQPAISKDLLEAVDSSGNVHSVGDPSYLSLHGVETLVYHGRSLDDVISTVPGMNHGQPEMAMRLLLQGRHLAPLYGGKTMLSPERKDFLVIERVPDIFHAGHIHVTGYCNYRGVLVVNSGGWQDRTDYMQRLGFTPTPGRVPLVNLQTLEVTILGFN